MVLQEGWIFLAAEFFKAAFEADWITAGLDKRRTSKDDIGGKKVVGLGQKMWMRFVC